MKRIWSGCSLLVERGRCLLIPFILFFSILVSIIVFLVSFIIFLYILETL